MSDAMRIKVHEDGSATAFVGISSQTFSEGNRKENTEEAVKWATKVLYNLEGEEFE